VAEDPDEHAGYEQQPCHRGIDHDRVHGSRIVADAAAARNPLLLASTLIKYDLRMPRGRKTRSELELNAICDRLARNLEAQVDELAAATFDLQAATLPEWLRQPPLDGQLRDFARDGIRAQLQALPVEEVPEELPPADAAMVRQAAEVGIPLALLLDGSRAAHRALWDAWSELVEEAGLDAGQARAARRRGSDFLFSYAARLSILIEEEYAHERDRRRRGAEERRLAAVRAVLEAEGEPDVEALDYPIEASHVAVLASGDGASEQIRSIARELDYRVLLLDVYPDPIWAWLGRARGMEARAEERVKGLAVGRLAQAGIGLCGRGADGFRESRRQASFAFEAAGHGGAVLSYADVALEDLASRDSEAAIAFLGTELGRLSGEDARSVQLRETLLAYFRCGQNARSAARSLGIHHQTVAQRLAAVEERIGCPVTERRAELEVALRLKRHLAQVRGLPSS